jgi:hypothetical protein
MERFMKSHSHAPVELTKQFSVEEQREDAALEDVPRNPFDRKDFLFFMIPIVILVFAMWVDASE